jgi:hypothetical protein
MKSMVLPSQACTVKLAPHPAASSVLTFNSHDAVSHLMPELPRGVCTKYGRNSSQTKAALISQAGGTFE